MEQLKSGMKGNINKYLNFIAYCLNEDVADTITTGIDFTELYIFSQQQAIVGVVFDGIDKLSKVRNIEISKELLFEWIGQCNLIETRNRLLNQRVLELVSYFQNNGFKSCILKGQGNAKMYPKPYLRMSGDIDIWVDGSKADIVNFIHSKFPGIIVAYHHMDFPLFNDVEVEVHYHPSYSYNYFHNHRLQKFFQNHGKEQFENIIEEGYSVPTINFNLIFQLSHMMRHFFTQGIGLRHAIDYYYLLKKAGNIDENNLLHVLKECGMYKFFTSIMWIETQVLGLNNPFNSITPNEKAGKLVLHEMIKGGNFGKQYTHWNDNVFINYFNQFVYNMRYIVEFPDEPITRPINIVCDYIRRHLFKQL